MQNFINKFENLSIEILLEIFDYLSINDCFNAFHHLNFTINSALNLAGYSIDLTSISSQTYEEFYEQIIFQNHYRQIRKLKVSNDLTLGLLQKFFTNYNLRDFKQLRSLTLIKPSYMTLSSLALIIPRLKQLEHLSINSNSYPDRFFQLVTTTSPSIKSCYFPGLELQEELAFESNIEYLTVTVEDMTILLNLLAVFPQLKYLNVTLRSTLYLDELPLPEFDSISCLNLQILQLYLLQRSSIDFKEIEYFFQQTFFHQLKSFSYNCMTNSLNHLHATRWKEMLKTYFISLEKLNFFVQIPLNAYSSNDLQQIRHDLQNNLSDFVPFSLSINSSSYIIHTDIYPKKHFDLSGKILQSEEYFNYDPMNCTIAKKFSKVNSLILESQSIESGTILPKNIKYLQIQGQKNDLTLNHCLQDCSKQLFALKIFGLPNHLPLMPNLRQLTVQQMMFDLNMAMKLSTLCPQLELLTIEIDCIKQFEHILNYLRYESNLTELKFIRAFSRDTTETWSSWVKESNPFDGDDIYYDVKSLFLFLWL